MSGIGEKIKNELRELIPVTVFFFLAFQLLALTQALALRQYGIRVTTFATAAIGALVAAKVVVITDHFKWVNRFPDKPLIYNVFWKTAIYFAASFIVRYVEKLIPFWRESAGFGEAHRKLMAAVVWPHFWGVQLWLLILLLLYCTFRELVRAIGRDRLIQIYFRDPPKGGYNAHSGHSVTSKAHDQN